MSRNAIKLTCAVLTLAIATGLSACGKSYPKLDDRQKAQVRETLDSTGRGVSAVGSRADNNLDLFRSNLNSDSPQGKIVGAVFGKSRKSAKADPQLEKMNQKLATAKNCEFLTSSKGNLKEYGQLNSVMPSSKRPSDFSFSIKAEGKDCPAIANLSATIVADGDSDFSGEFALEYQVQDSDYLDYNDIDAINIKGSLAVNKTQGSRNSKTDFQNGAVEFDFDLSGTLHSQELKEIAFTLTAEGSSSFDASTRAFTQSGSIVLTLDYADFGAKFEVEQSGKEKPTFLVNNEVVTQAEFLSYFENLPGADKIEDSMEQSRQPSEPNSENFEDSENFMSSGAPSTQN